MLAVVYPARTFFFLVELQEFTGSQTRGQTNTFNQVSRNSWPLFTLHFPLSWFLIFPSFLTLSSSSRCSSLLSMLLPPLLPFTFTSPSLHSRGRHKDRRPGLGPRPQQPRTSPKPPKKQMPPQAPPPPPTPTTLSPTSSDSKNPAKQENGVIKSERPSYARVAKAQPPSPPPPPPPRTLPSSTTPSSPHPPPLPSNQPKQCTPTSPQAKTGSSSSNSCNDTAVPSVVGNSQPSTASEGGTGTAQNSS